ncbi:hypothetical protein BD410DRAFT_780655 [Rickenella mellea]|uniref:Uncharacterized protein n=1 Tax=Rickenella mellea TaxID=50990 RepID=A0A4R5XG19_9AGAM|nr:hypothetical protein BD410DRAFT_780655 [Rickenella mellea]
MNPSFNKWTWRSVPPLHSVELSRCDLITGGFVESFVNELVRNDHSAEDRMRKFTVANCGRFSTTENGSVEAKLGGRFILR